MMVLFLRLGLVTPRFLLVIFTFLAMGPQTFAHHGFGTFDLNSTVNLTGKITKVDFINPHAWVYLEVEDENGKIIPWRCEMRAATVLKRSGWSKSLFVKGDSINISGARDTRDPQTCYLSSVQFSNGNSTDRYGQLNITMTQNNAFERQKRLSNGKPNLAGDWAQEQYVMEEANGLSGRLVPLSVAQGIGEIKENKSPWVASHVNFTSLGLELSKANNPRSFDAPRMRCEFTSIIFDWDFDGPINQIVQTEHRVIIRYGRHGVTRIIHLDQTDIPMNIEPTRTGYSLGHWEGDTLVVNSTNFLPGILSGNVANSSALEVIERFSVNTNEWTLLREYKAKDPEIYSDFYTGSSILKLAELPYEVDECTDLTNEDFSNQDRN